MKTVFLTPPSTLEERYGTFKGSGSSMPALGILMLAAVARKAGHETSVLDATASNLSLQQTLQWIAEKDPDVVGISSTTVTVTQAGALAEAIKSSRPGVTTVIGGPHVTPIPEETLSYFPGFDIAVIGEGEETIIELLEALESAGSLSDIPGLAIRKNGEIHRTAARTYISTMDDLPFPAWDLLEGFPARFRPAAVKARKLPAATLVTSRGCPNKCNFCDRSVFGASCHGYSAEYVVGMIRELHSKYGVREISFEDDTFVTFRNRLRTICEKLIEMDIDLSWSCLGRVNSVDPETLGVMKRAGCWQISFGIETGSDEILRNIGKNINVEQVRQAVRWTSGAGILTKGFFILGHPGETADTLEMTRQLAINSGLDDISVSMLTPFPGTEIYDKASEFGTFDRDWTKMNLLTPVFVPDGLTFSDLETAQKKLLRNFYFRLSVILNYAGRVLRNPRLGLQMAKALVAFLRSTG